MKSDAFGPFVEKDPDASLDYEVDWSAWLKDGDTLADSLWLVNPTGELVVSAPAWNAAGATVLRLTGGIAGRIYTVTSRIVTADGNEDDRSFRVYVRQR